MSQALLRGLLLWALLSGIAAGQAQTEAPVAPEGIAWTSDEVGVGITWRAAHLDDLFGAPQSINVLAIDLPRRTRRLRFAAPDPFARVPTSTQARERGALAAVNGGFFDTKAGAPFGLFRRDGEMLIAQDERRSVAIGVDSRERVTIESRGPGDWPGVDHARGSWPLILRNGEPVKPDGWGPKDRRHPRTATGLTADGHLVLATVDGRTASAAGMTLLELARTMQALGCMTAMNLDGGGSTTMWIRGRGVVNFPSDNGRFDHQGERAVADAVLVFAPLVLRLDEDRATLTPEDAWRRDVADDECVGGDCAHATRTGAEARFDVELPAPGRYRIELRWPRVRSAPRRLDCIVGDREPLRADPRRTPHSWESLGTLALEGEQTTVLVRTPTGERFGLDALRLVEVPAEGEAGRRE